MTNRKTAHRYSKALYGLAESTGKVDEIKKDFEDIKKSIDASRELRQFINSPVINPEKKAALVVTLFEGRVSDMTMKFLALLCEKKRVNILHDIASSVLGTINEERGIVEAKITTAVEINENGKKAIIEKLKKYSGKDILPHFSVDRSIKGGFIAQIDDKMIDASILRQLELLKEKFMQGSFNN